MWRAPFYKTILVGLIQFGQAKGVKNDVAERGLRIRKENRW